MITNQGSILSFSIPAGEGVPYSLNAAGRHFALLNASGPVRVKIDNMPYSIFRAGQCLDIDHPDSFERIEFYSPSGKMMEISVWVGFAAFRDNRMDQVEAPTSFLSVNDGEMAIAANGTVDLTGEPTEKFYRRKCIVVSNLDPAVPLYLMNQDNQTVGVVRAGETISHPVSGFVRIKNKATAAVSAVVSEIWWSL